MATKSKKLTPFQEEQVKAAKKIKEYKLSCEANIVSIFYKDSDTMFNCDVKIEDISENVWKVYYQIAHDIVLKEKKPVLDEITVGLYLEKHDKLRGKYEEYGGWEKIIEATTYVNTQNLEGYIKDLNKWNTILKLIKYGFPVYDKLSEYADKSIDEIYDELEATLNHAFINADNNAEAHQIDDNIDELLDKLDKGFSIGLPYFDMPLINAETSGQLHGNVTLVGGLSNVGKSTFCRTTTIPSILSHNEKLVVIVNEEGLAKWQTELIVWVANNIFKENLEKYVIRDGNFTESLWELLRKCNAWIKKMNKDHAITIVTFKQYNIASTLKHIRKYAHMGVKYFLIDTFKDDAGAERYDTGSIANAMAQAMVTINDLAKESNLDIHVMCTFQLNKASVRQRFYTQDNIGSSKRIIDPVSTCIMIRNLFDDEMPTGKNPLKVYRLEGKNGKVKIPVMLDSDKRYQVVFIVKNRQGSANQYQIVIEHDLSRNVMKEIGITHVHQDI